MFASRYQCGCRHCCEQPDRRISLRDRRRENMVVSFACYCVGRMLKNCGIVVNHPADFIVPDAKDY